MRHRVDVHDYERRLTLILKKIERSPICQSNKQLLLEFYNHTLTRGLSNARVIKYLCTLEIIARIMGKPLREASSSDIADFVREIECRDYSAWTKHDYKVIVKIFYRWLRKTSEYPEEVRWIKVGVKKHSLLPEEVLTEDDVKRLMETAGNLRDKALIFVLYESGCRIGEVLSLRLRNVQFDEYGAVLIVSGKTGDRRVRIISSAPKLASWIENHPFKNDPKAPLWVSYSTRNMNEPLSYAATKVMIQKVSRRADIKKRVYPHLFRHSRATFLANFLTEAQLKQFFGWVQGSDMASTYVHLSGRDVDNALFSLQGMKQNETKKETQLKVTLCPRCNEKNSPPSKFCMRCGAPLDMKTALKLDETRAKADKLMTMLVRDPEILEKLLAKIKDMQA